MIPSLGFVGLSRGGRRPIPIPLPLFLLWPFVGLCWVLAEVPGIARLARRSSAKRMEQRIESPTRRHSAERTAERLNDPTRRRSAEQTAQGRKSLPRRRSAAQTAPWLKGAVLAYCQLSGLRVDFRSNGRRVVLWLV